MAGDGSPGEGDFQSLTGRVTGASSRHFPHVRVDTTVGWRQRLTQPKTGMAPGNRACGVASDGVCFTLKFLFLTFSKKNFNTVGYGTLRLTFSSKLDALL